MKQFNLEDWKAGKPVITRSGKNVRQLTYFNPIDNQFCLFGIVDNVVQNFTKYGKFNDCDEHDFDLFHPEEEIWVNLYKQEFNNYHTGYLTYDTEEQAKNKIIYPDKYVGTFKINKQ